MRNPKLNLVRRKKAKKSFAEILPLSVGFSNKKNYDLKKIMNVSILNFGRHVWCHANGDLKKLDWDFSSTGTLGKWFKNLLRLTIYQQVPISPNNLKYASNKDTKILF